MVELDDGASPRRPDTKIKIYLEPEDADEERAVHRELERFRGGLVLKLAENVAGNVFNRPFPYLALRPVSTSERLPEDLSDDGDPTDDFFVTLKALGVQTESECGFVIMGYKTLHNEDGCGGDLDASWAQWTGAAELARALARDYAVERVHCWKAPNAKQDHFKYLVMIEVAGGDAAMLYAKDTLQRFRIRKMSGYVALYTLWDHGRESARREQREREIEAVRKDTARAREREGGAVGGRREVLE